MKEYYTVGEVSKIFNISIDALRYYDKLDILKPYIIGENGYRYYYIGQFEIISTIKLLKSLDLPLDEIKILTHEEDLEEIKNSLKKGQLVIDKKIKHLEELREKTKSICHKIDEINYITDIHIRKRPEMWAILTESLYDSKDSMLPQKIENDLEYINKDWMSFTNIVSIIDKSKFHSGIYYSYVANGLISTSTCDMESKKATYYPEEYCVFKCVSLDQDKYHLLEAAYEEMREWIIARGLEINGDIMEINIYNQFLSNNNLRNHLQIWIPIKKDKSKFDKLKRGEGNGIKGFKLK